MVDDPPPSAFGQLADLGPAAGGDVGRDMPPRVAAGHQRVADAGDGRPRGVPRAAPAPAPAPRPASHSARSRRRPTRSARWPRPGCPPRRRPAPAARLAAPPRLGGVEHAGQPARRPSRRRCSAARPGSACGRASVCRGGFRPVRESVRTWAASSSPMRASASRRHSISAVSTTSWLVRPRCSQRAVGAGARAPQQRDEADDRVAVGVGAARRSSRRRRRPAAPPRSARAAAGAIPASTSAVQPRLFDRDHRRQERAVAHQRRRRGGRPARTGRSWSMSRVAQEDGFAPSPLQSDVEPQAVLVAGRDQGVTAFGGQRGQQRVICELFAGQVGAGEQPVEQAAGEDGDRE